jgi:hypothetical protein
VLSRYLYRQRGLLQHCYVSVLGYFLDSSIDRLNEETIFILAIVHLHVRFSCLLSSEVQPRVRVRSS